MNEIALASLTADQAYVEAVARHLDLIVLPHEERSFEGGEHKIRPLASVRNNDVYIVQSLYGDETLSVNDKLIRLFFFIGALRDSGAARITLICPYMAYARKDRQTKSRDPVSSRYLAQLFEAVRIDRFVTMEVHNLAAFQNAFRCPTEHLTLVKPLVAHFSRHLAEAEITVASPDVGGVKRAEHFRLALANAMKKDIDSGFMEKYRSKDVVSGHLVAGEFQNREVIVLDDLIASGGTMTRAAAAFLARGAKAIHAVATHGLFVGDAAAHMDSPALSSVVISNTLPPFRLPDALLKKKVTVIDTTPLVARTIAELHHGGSIVALLGEQENE